jgi:hypothetical protein
MTDKLPPNPARPLLDAGTPVREDFKTFIRRLEREQRETRQGLTELLRKHLDDARAA